MPPTDPSSPSNGNANDNSNANASDNSNANDAADNSNGNASDNSNSNNNAADNTSANGSPPRDLSLNIPPIVTYTLDETIVGDGYQIQNQQGQSADGDEITHSTFFTTDLSNSDVQITENLTEIVETYYDDGQDTATKQVMDEIKLYASKIQCEDFHGKGTIDDYSQLFIAASKIANETKQIKLDVDVEGFNEFSQAADDLSELFTSFIVKLENVNIINDLDFLRSISIALSKIWNLSEVFGKFKETILATSTIQIPKSAHDTKVILEGVMGEINCAMKYITHFVAPTENVPFDADLSLQEKTIIDKAVETIDKWGVFCEHGVSIAMENNPDVEFIKSASASLKTKTATLQNATQSLKTKFALYNIVKIL